MKKFIAGLLLKHANKLRKKNFGLNHPNTQNLHGNLGLTHSQSSVTNTQPKTITLSNPDLIESTINGLFTDFNGVTTINLTNGQQWQQVDTTVVSYSANSVDVVNVTIRKHGKFWKMKVDGISKEVTVRKA